MLLAALAIVAFADRIAIASAGPRIQEELRIPPERWGWILGVFVVSYGGFAIPLAALGNRAGQRRVLSGIVLWWSMFTSLTGAAVNFLQLLSARFLFGIGEAGAYPNMSAVVARWFPTKERARAEGVIWAASRVGGALAPLALLPLQAVIGWRWTFVCFGAVGMVWTAIWHSWFRDDPARQPGITADELREIAAGAAPAPPACVPWKRLLGRPQLWLIFVMYFCYAWTPWFFFGWFPMFLVHDAGFTHAQMAMFSALPFALGAAANLAGGYLGDRLAVRFGLRVGRRLIGCASLAMASVLLLAATLTENRAAVVVFSSLSFGIADLMLPSAWAVCLDVGREHAGIVSSIMNTAGQLGGVLCSVVFGYAVAMTGSYRQPVWIVAATAMTAALLFARIDSSRRLLERG